MNRRDYERLERSTVAQPAHGASQRSPAQLEATGHSLADGQSTASRILALQRSAGNAAVTSLLTRGRQGSAARGLIQRYSERDLADPKKIDWLSETTEVERPGEGVSGGVYIMKSANGTLVAKPELLTTEKKGLEGEGSTTEEERADENRVKMGKASFSTTFLKNALEFQTPEMRIVDRDKQSAEFNELKITIHSKMPKAEEGKPRADSDFSLRDVRHFAILGHVSGGSVAGRSAKAGKATMAEQDTWHVKSLLDDVTNPAFLVDVGRLVVGDALLYNDDRLSSTKSNIGNIMMLPSGRAAAIDSGTHLQFPTRANRLMYQLEDIARLFSDQGQAVLLDALMSGVKQNMRNQGVTDETIDFWLTPELHKEAEKRFRLGVRLGIQQLAANLQKADVRTTLEEEARRYPSKVLDWKAYLVRERYFLLLAGGIAPEAALEGAKAYFETLAQPPAEPAAAAAAPAPRGRRGLGGSIAKGLGAAKKLFGRR